MKVLWSETARRAMDRIFSYIEERNPLAAERVAYHIIHAGESLSQWPYRCRQRGDGLRTLRVLGTPYLIRYEVRSRPQSHADEDYVLILDVRHGAQNDDLEPQ